MSKVLFKDLKWSPAMYRTTQTELHGMICNIHHNLSTDKYEMCFVTPNSVVSFPNLDKYEVGFVLAMPLKELQKQIAEKEKEIMTV